MDENEDKGRRPEHDHNGKPIKSKRPYKAGNTDENDDYIVGYKRPPGGTRFAPNDGRPRGRKPKGARSFDKDFAAEAARKVTLRENGKPMRVTKQVAAIRRVFDNGISKAENPALAQIFEHGRRISDKAAANQPLIQESDREILEAYLAERFGVLAAGAMLGDPEPEDGAQADDTADKQDGDGNGD